MKNVLLFGMIAAIMAGPAAAMDEYNRPPAGDKVYASCLKNAASNYEGGNEASKVPGQTNIQAFCTCMWNETPENFKGNLVAFSETAKGAATNKMCEKHSGWGQ